MLTRQAWEVKKSLQAVSWRFRGSVLKGVIQVRIKAGSQNWMARPWTVVLNLILPDLRNLHQLAGRARHASRWAATRRAASQPALGKPRFQTLPRCKVLSRPPVPSCFRSSHVILRTLQRVEDRGTGRSHGNEAPQKPLREPGRDFPRRQQEILTLPSRTSQSPKTGFHLTART